MKKQNIKMNATLKFQVKNKHIVWNYCTVSTLVNEPIQVHYNGISASLIEMIISKIFVICIFLRIEIILFY